MQRTPVIIVTVVLFHVAALWALQTGLLRRTLEIMVRAEVLSEFITPPAPKLDVSMPPPPEPRRPPRPAKQPAVRPTTRQPMAIADPTPVPDAPTGVLMAQPTAPPIATPVAPAAPVAPTASPAPPAPVRLELPSSDADYLNNPKPAYPILSKRLGEQGKVVVRVLIGPDGLAKKGEIRTSSGYQRLDQAALATVMSWRFVPGKRSGVPEAMWFNIPLNFVLE